MTHAEACHAAFARAGLWHWIGEGRRLTHFLRTGRWMPSDTALARPYGPPIHSEDCAPPAGGDWPSYG